MRICTLLIFFIASCNFLFGQISYSPNPIEVTADKGTENIQTDFELKNEGADTVLLAWKMDVVGQPTEWNFYVCDTEICYNFGDSVSSTARPNIIPPGGSIIVMFHTLPATVEGQGEYKIEFFDVSFPDSLKIDVPITVNTITSATANIEVKGLSIFPNPAGDFFRINTGALVSTIDIVTVVGKKVSSFSAHQGGYYDISDLHSGMYYVRLLDDKGESMKVVKLKKD